MIPLVLTPSPFLHPSLQKLLREARVWSRLEHPNISRFLGMSFDAHMTNQPCLVSPYYRNGDLSMYLRKEGDKVDKLEIVRDLYGVYLDDA